MDLAVPMSGTPAVPMPERSEAGGQATPSNNISKGQPSNIRGLLACPPPTGAVPMDPPPAKQKEVRVIVLYYYA